MGLQVGSLEKGCQQEETNTKAILHASDWLRNGQNFTLNSYNASKSLHTFFLIMWYQGWI